MRITTATDPGRAEHPNEDHCVTDPETGVVVVCDGATARTDTGCEHGTAWYAQTLATALADRAPAGIDLRGALADAIGATAEAHPGCDLTHPGSPSATVAAVRPYSDDAIEVLVLGDATVVVATDEDVRAYTQSVDHVARAERDAACALPIGNPRREKLLVKMKQVMHAHRNTSGGYWVAAADAGAAYRSLAKVLPVTGVQHVLVLTDGAAALVDTYGAVDWAGLVALAAAKGPAAIIKQVRDIEDTDPEARTYRRTKRSDDASAVLIEYLAPGTEPAQSSSV